MRLNKELRDTLEENVSVQTSPTENTYLIQHELVVGQHGGGRRWPIWIVQLICELLVSGAAPSSIPDIILTTTSMNNQHPPKSLPSVNFIRECRVVVQIIGETLAAIKLARAKTWGQLFTDGTSRRQISLQNVIVGLMDDSNQLNPLVVSSCIFLEDETSEKQTDGIIEKIQTLKGRLTRLREVVHELCPHELEHLPLESEVDISKLGHGGVITTDTCNAAQKSRRILVERIGGDTHEMDCMHHLRNVWFGGIEKALTTYLNALLKDSLENIDSHLRVSTSMSALIRAFDKEFSLCANYPKGHGEEFKEWIKKNHPGELLLHVERASGSRQDLFVEGAPAVYWNRQYCIEFLDEQLRLPSKGNVLQENLFIVLSSLEMVGLSRILSILYLCIVIPVRWLSAKTHTLGKYNWGARSMGRVLDILEANTTRPLVSP